MTGVQTCALPIWFAANRQKDYGVVARVTRAREIIQSGNSSKIVSQSWGDKSTKGEDTAGYPAGRITLAVYGVSYARRKIITEIIYFRYLTETY